MQPADHVMEETLRRASAYFMGISDVHQTARTLAERFREAGIDFVIAGALAVNAHGLVRMTEDVDVLVSREGLQRFKDRWLGRGYLELRPGGKPIRDTETNVKIDFLIAGDYPGDGRPKPVRFPDPKSAAVPSDQYPYLELNRLIELKLASAMTKPDRLQDLADVMRLIRANALPGEYRRHLDPYVHQKFDEMWEMAQTPQDEY